MVDALREAWRVLSPNGVLIDLRPFPASRCPIEVVTPKQAVQVGEVDASGAVDDDEAADRAIGRFLEDGWFRRRRMARFGIEFCWDTVSEMAAFMKGSQRMRRISPSYAELEKAHHRWMAKAGPMVRIRATRPMLLAVYRKASPVSSVQARAGPLVASAAAAELVTGERTVSERS